MNETLILLPAIGIGLLIGFVITRYVCKIRVDHQEKDFSTQKQVLEFRLQEKENQLALHKAEFTQLLQEKEETREHIAQLRERLVQVETQRQADLKLAEEKIHLISKAEAQLQDTFKALSQKALQSNNQQFLDLATSNLEKWREGAKSDLEKRQLAIEHLVDPLKKSLEGVTSKIEALEKERVGAYASVTEQIKSLLVTQGRLESETANLVKALRTPHVRGRWGEMQLRRSVELAGMLAYVDFQEQVTCATENGSQRPDMIVNLPNGRNIVVDAKVALSAYLEALETQDPELQISHLKTHARQIRDHLTHLGSKSYWKQFENSLDFVILFLPGEAFFSAALQADPELIDFGLTNRVLLATPTTIIALLKSVAFGWKQEEVAKQAKTIAQLGRDLYERMATLATHFCDMKRSLERTVISYNKAVGSMESRVLPMARRFKDLHVTSDEILPELDLVDSMPIDTKTEELAVPEVVVN